MRTKKQRVVFFIKKKNLCRDNITEHCHSDSPQMLRDHSFNEKSFKKLLHMRMCACVCVSGSKKC